MYLDAGHAGWLGWPANLQPAANLFAQVYSNASKPASVRGLATNVANYNAWTISPCPSYTSGDSNCDESLYIHALSPLVSDQGFDASFITDTCGQPTLTISRMYVTLTYPSAQWRPANETKCVGRLVQRHWNWLRCSSHGRHGRQSPRFVCVGEAGR